MSTNSEYYSSRIEDVISSFDFESDLKLLVDSGFKVKRFLFYRVPDENLLKRHIRKRLKECILKDEYQLYEDWDRYDSGVILYKVRRYDDGLIDLTLTCFDVKQTRK